jgi:hypothetical protein
MPPNSIEGLSALPLFAAARVARVYTARHVRGRRHTNQCEPTPRSPPPSERACRRVRLSARPRARHAERYAPAAAVTPGREYADDNMRRVVMRIGRECSEFVGTP